jgi:plastocyanin
MRTHRTRAAIRSAVLGVVALGLVACAGDAPGWTFAPVPSATPVPSGSPDGSAVPSDAAPSDPLPSGPASSPVAGGLEISAENVAFDKAELSAPAGEPFPLVFHNEDAGVPHNVAIHEGSPTGPEVFKGEVFNGIETRTYQVPALDAGTYGFVCTVHPNMTGTLTAG